VKKTERKKLARDRREGIPRASEAIPTDWLVGSKTGKLLVIDLMTRIVAVLNDAGYQFSTDAAKG